MPTLSKPADVAELVKEFDHLPDDAIVSAPVSRAVRGGISRWTDQRHPPSIPWIAYAGSLRGHRVGDLRKLIRGEIPQPSAA
jgi:hypothetical protein